MKATKRKLPSRSKRAQAFLESNPAASVNEVTFRFDMTKQSVYALRNKMKKEGFDFPKRTAAQHVESILEDWEEKDSQEQKQTGIEMYDYADQVDETLDARAVDYGKFIEGAEVMQMLKRVVLNALNNRDKTLAHDQAEAMDMIIHKIGRIVNGNPDVVDHWLDIAGYAKLVADRLEGRVR
jgi:transposase